MGMRHRRSAAAGFLVPLAVCLLAAACTSTPKRTAHTSTAPSSGGPTTSSIAVTASTPPVSTDAPPTIPPQFVRQPRKTAIGDPATADLCAAVGKATFEHLGTSPVTLDALQYPPGCSFTLSGPREPVLTVSVFAARHGAPAPDGRTKRTSSGLTVYRYPFDARTGGCERDVVATGVRFVADAITRGSAKPDKRLSCRATDAMADRVAEVVANRSVPRLGLAQPTLLELNACRIVTDAGITGLSDFASADVIRRGFAVNCELRTDRVFLFINVAIAASAPPAGGTPISVNGHRLYRIAARPRFCSYASVQGATGVDGQREELTAASTVPVSGKPPEHLCDQTVRALARYLSAAGLR
jgi:hypothetical protein